MEDLSIDLHVVSTALARTQLLRALDHTLAMRELTPSVKSAKLRTASRPFGFTNPVLIDKHGTIMAGHGHVQAAGLLGLSHVPTIRFDHLTEDQVRAYVIADNRLAENAGWDPSILAIELHHLLAIETDFDIMVTGFEIPEIDLLIESAKEISREAVTLDPEDLGPSVTEAGDTWQLGRRRVLCANSLLDSSFRALLAGKKAGIVLADPPYGVKIDGHATGNGSVHHREFAMGCGETTEAEFVAFLTTGGSAHFVFMSWHHLHELLTAGKQVYDSLLNIVVWIKDQAGMGSLYRSQHELCPVFRHGKEPPRNNIQLGRFGRNRTNVWIIPRCGPSRSRGKKRTCWPLHPTPKPLSLLSDAILDCSACGDLILDSFLGLGSTLLAAEKVERICYGLEIDAAYIDLTSTWRDEDSPVTNPGDLDEVKRVCLYLSADRGQPRSRISQILHPNAGLGWKTPTRPLLMIGTLNPGL